MILQGFIIAFLCLIIDQVQKFYMIEIYKIPEKAPVVVTNFFNLVMVWNKGISFGMFQNLAKSNYMFLGISSFIIIIISYFIYNSKSKLETSAFGMIIGGALGNIIDRIQYGAVADFFDFHIGTHHWPAFNIADSCIFCGAALLIIYSFFWEKNENK